MVAAMTDAPTPEEPVPHPLKLPVKRVKFKVAKTASDDRRALKLLTTKAVKIAICVEASRREVSYSALIIEALRRSFPAIAAAIEGDTKRKAG